MASSSQPDHVFEVYCLGDKLDITHWQSLYKALMAHLGLLGGKFTVTFTCKDNVVRFFVLSKKDIGSLSNSIEGFLLRPCPAEDAAVPEGARTEHFVNFVEGGNLLDLKERYQIKKGKSLTYATFSVRSLTYENAVVTSSLYFEVPGHQWTKASKMMTGFPAQLLAIDFGANTHYLKKSMPKYLNIEKSMQMLNSENVNALLEVDTFPYFDRPYYLNLTSYEFDKHSFIVGASGSGKSKFISLFVDRLQKSTAVAMNYHVVVIDPHASITDDFNHIDSKKVINFGNESTELFSGTATDISAATELTGTLFRSLMSENATAKTDRLLRFSLYVLLTAQAMSLGNLKRFLTEVELRDQLLDHVRGYVPDNIIHFFGADFNDLRTKYYNETISPIVSLVDEMQMQPALVGEGELSLSKTIEENFLTVFSLNKVSMGDKVVKTVAGLLIQQIFLLAQARAFSQRILLIIDEVSVVQNPALAQILSEARKFGLSVMLTQQYFGQIDKELQDSIFTNVFNYYAFKVSEEDARTLEGNLTIELPKDIVEAEHAKGVKEQDIRVKIMTSLHPRECIVRVLANGQVIPAVKARTLDAPATKNPASSGKLKPYKQVDMPEKFQEKASEQITRQHIPDTEPATPTVSDHLIPTESVLEIKTELTSENNPEQYPITEPAPSRHNPSETHTNKLGSLAAMHADDTEGPEASGPLLSSLEPQTFNLSDLLAEHSSSRTKVNKKKGN